MSLNASSISTKYISGSILWHSRSCSCCTRKLIWRKNRIIILIHYIIYSWTLLSFCVNWQNRLLNKWTFKSRSVFFRNNFFCWFFSDWMSILINLLSSTQKLIISNLTSSGSSGLLIVKVILIFVFNHWCFIAELPRLWH